MKLVCSTDLPEITQSNVSLTKRNISISNQKLGDLESKERSQGIEGAYHTTLSIKVVPMDHINPPGDAGVLNYVGF